MSKGDNDFLEVEMSDGTVWRIPVHVIAADRAKYYAAEDAQNGGGEFADIFASEYRFAMGNDDELLDWAANNMNWVDVAPYARKIERNPIPTHYVEDWTNAPKRVVRSD